MNTENTEYSRWLTDILGRVQYVCVCVSRSSPSSSFLPLLKEPFPSSFSFLCLLHPAIFSFLSSLFLFAHLFLSFPSVYFYIFLPPASLAFFLYFTRSFSPRLFFSLPDFIFLLAAFSPLILSLPLFLSWLFHVTLSSYFLSFYCSSPHSFLLPVFFLFLFRIFSQFFFVTTVVVILFNM